MMVSMIYSTIYLPNTEREYEFLSIQVVII
jgi:hypothetical protein